MLYAFLSLLGIVGGCSLRSRILALPAGAGQVVDFELGANDRPDYALVYQFRGAGIGAAVQYSLIEPPVAGAYGISSDTYEVALGGDAATGLRIRFTNLTAIALNIEVYFARFSKGQLEDLRCLVGFPSDGAAAIMRKQMEQMGITA